MNILIMSCDKYSDAWNAFFTLFFRYWPDCPYPVWLCTEAEIYPDQRVQPLLTGPGLTWCSMLEHALRKLPDTRVLILQEDFLLNRPVDTPVVRTLLHTMAKHQAGCIRIFPSPGPQNVFDASANIGVFESNQAWRVSCQATVWDKSALLEILDPCESIQEFEVNGTHRSGQSKRLYLGIRTIAEGLPDYGPYPFTYIATGIIQRRWTRRAASFLQSEGIQMDLNRRGIESGWTLLYRTLQFRRAKVDAVTNLILHLMDFIAHRTERVFGVNIRERRVI